MVELTSTPFKRSPEVACGRESKDGAVAGLAAEAGGAVEAAAPDIVFVLVAAAAFDFCPLLAALALLPLALLDCLLGICNEL